MKNLTKIQNRDNEAETVAQPVAVELTDTMKEEAKRLSKRVSLRRLKRIVAEMADDPAATDLDLEYYRFAIRCRECIESGLMHSLYVR